MKFTRRALASLFAAIPLLGHAKATPPARRRYQVPPSLWYENEAGEKWIPDENQLMTCEPPPEGFIFQHFTESPLRESICKLLPDGSGPQIAAFCSGWSEDLVIAFANDGYRLTHAIRLAASFCERCMNAAAHEYGLPWGYPRYSEKWLKAHTICDFCRDEPVAVGTGYARIVVLENYLSGRTDTQDFINECREVAKGE